MSLWLEKTDKDSYLKGDWLDDFRQRSLSSLKQTEWPNRRTEDWRYLSLKDIEKITFPESSDVVSHEHVPTISALHAIELHFVDGRLVTDLSGIALPEGLSIQKLTYCDEDAQKSARKYLGNIKPQRHLFGLINDVKAKDGIYIDVAQGSTIDTPIRLVFQINGQVETHQRVLVNLGAEAKATVIEESYGNVASFNSVVSEFQLNASSELVHYRLAMQCEEAMQVGGCHFNLLEKAQLNSNIIGFGSKLSRLDVDVIHAGEFANAKINGVYLLKDAEVFDLHTTIEHAVPNGTTSETIRGIAANHSKAIFNGRIHIHRDAQKTLAELSNKNLLLARTAQINTKPELEIYADDVRCAHGATVAELDTQALYYLCSRGINKEKALVMMNYGFINSVINMMPNEAMTNWLKAKLEQRFAQLEY